MAERNQKIRLGGFIALATAALTGLVVLFGGTPRVFSSRTDYVVLYPEAPGVSPGTPVRKSGVRIGQVKGIDIDEETGKVRVTVEVENKYLPRQNEEPAISRGLLSGDTTIDFIPRIDSKGQPIERLDYYPGEHRNRRRSADQPAGLVEPGPRHDPHRRGNPRADEYHAGRVRTRGPEGREGLGTSSPSS